MIATRSSEGTGKSRVSRNELKSLFRNDGKRIALSKRISGSFSKLRAVQEKRRSVRTSYVSDSRQGSVRKELGEHKLVCLVIVIYLNCILFV